MSSLIIQNGNLVTMNSENKAVKGSIYIENGIIKEINTSRKEADKVIDAEGNWVLPGFVQPHVHLCQTLFKGLADDMNVIDWLRERIWPLEQAHNYSSMYNSARLGIAELLKSGTTSIMSMETTNHTSAVFEAIKDSGIRATTGKAIMDYTEDGTEMDAENTGDSLRKVKQQIKKWHNSSNGRIQYALCPRGPRNCTGEMFEELLRLSNKHDLIIHSHAAENGEHTKYMKEKTGLRDIEVFEKYNLTDSSLTLAHCIWVNEEELKIMNKKNINVVHCPSANMKLASGFAKVPEMLEKNINVALGADGAPCNNNLNMFNEMRLASLIHKPEYGAEAVPAEKIVEIATSGGSKAMGLEKKIGLLKPGYKADIIIVKRDSLRGSPYKNVSPFSQIVYSLNENDVFTTIVDGKILVNNGQLNYDSEEKIINNANSELEKLLQRADIT